MPHRTEGPFYVSREDYLAAERVAATKSEWVDGTVYAMAGASRNHVTAVSTMMELFARVARERGCFVGASDMLVGTANASYYPDLVISCEPGSDPYVEYRPCFIAEVLSPSTNRIDRIEKRDAYLAIDTMRTYWIVDADHADHKVIEAWVRTEDGWRGSHHTAGEPLEVACLGLTVRVVDVVGV